MLYLILVCLISSYLASVLYFLFLHVVKPDPVIFVSFCISLYLEMVKLPYYHPTLVYLLLTYTILYLYLCQYLYLYGACLHLLLS